VLISEHYFLSHGAGPYFVKNVIIASSDVSVCMDYYIGSFTNLEIVIK